MHALCLDLKTPETKCSEYATETAVLEEVPVCQAPSHTASESMFASPCIMQIQQPVHYHLGIIHESH